MQDNDGLRFSVLPLHEIKTFYDRPTRIHLPSVVGLHFVNPTYKTWN